MKIICCGCGAEIERRDALVHLAEKGCEDRWVLKVSNPYGMGMILGSIAEEFMWGLEDEEGQPLG